MIILVVNAGSSTLKYQLIDTECDTPLARGCADRIGAPCGELTQDAGGRRFARETPIPAHRDAIAQAVEALTAPEVGVLSSLDQIDAVGHRAVHGADVFVEPALVTDEVERQLEDCVPLAPLHNPANLLGIREARRLIPGVAHVAVFDTAFHSTMPRRAYTYALPLELCERERIRKYGFHGTSCQYVSQRAAAVLDASPADLKLVVCHLGNGASVTAVAGGRSVDTSLGFGTMCGVAMGTRAGDVDPAVVFHLHRTAGMELGEVERMLYHESGLLGLSGLSNDMRAIEERALQGNDRCALALEVFAYRVKLHVGAYAAAMDGLDALVFTAGIGENSATVRRLVCEDLGVLGVRLDEDANQACDRGDRRIDLPGSSVPVLVIPTDEERMIAIQTEEVVVAHRGLAVPR